MSWRRVRLVLGILLVLTGVVWLLQGVGVLPGSFMTGERIWAIIGGACILLGASLLLPRQG